VFDGPDDVPHGQFFDDVDYQEGVEFIQEYCPEAAALWDEWIDNETPYITEAWPSSNPDPKWS